MQATGTNPILSRDCIAGLGTIAGAAPRKAAASPPRFDASDLYGKNGPKAQDIQQNSLGDCYFIAPMAAIAKQQPGRIKDMIRFDNKTDTFVVKLHGADGKVREIRVTQRELADNIDRGGGSTADNTGKDKRIWPAVIETAYAKMHDSNPRNGLDEGYRKIGNGGWPADAMQALTGSRGSEISYSRRSGETQDQALTRLARQVDAALGNGRPVNAWSVPENGSRQDGLVDDHVYTVEKVTRNKDGDWVVSLRNPWHTNQGVGEGHDQANAVIEVPLARLVNTGGLHTFVVGPAR